jgi:hypothetical protein
MRVAGSGCASPRDIDEAWAEIQVAALSNLALAHNARPDGRGFADVRPLQLSVRLSLWPLTMHPAPWHGMAVSSYPPMQKVLRHARYLQHHWP